MTTQTTGTTETTDVVIAGAGPNGLMLACELALAGASPIVLERLAEPVDTQRANGIIGQAVRVLDRRGLYERLTEQGAVAEPKEEFVFGAFPLPLADLPDSPLHGLGVPQRRVERTLRERAAELGVDVRRAHELTGVVQHDDGVTVELRDRPPIETRYLVGADGAHSAVRKLAGIGFPGVTRDDSVSRAAHVSVPSEHIGAHGELVVPGFGTVPFFQHLRTEYGVIVWAPFPGRDPMISTIEWHQPEDGEASLDELRASVSRVLGGADVPLGPPTDDGPHLMRRLFGGNTRIAETFRSRRLLLIGDAAHVHSAIGGPGLNLGLQDAANLGWKLAAVARGDAPDDLLDTYEAERAPAAHRVAMQTQAQHALIRPGGDVTALRELFGELLEYPSTRAHLARLLSGWDIAYDMGVEPGAGDGPLVGRFAPDVPGLRELSRTARPLLLDPTGLLDATRWKDRVDTVTIPELDTALLVRPDGYVAWQGATEGGLRSALSRWFGSE